MVTLYVNVIKNSIFSDSGFGYISQFVYAYEHNNGSLGFRVGKYSIVLQNNRFCLKLNNEIVWCSKITQNILFLTSPSAAGCKDL